jgi:hypothetical protein
VAVMREILSDVSHDIWSHWMRWMFSVGTFNSDGSWTMPAEKVQRWQRQMNTAYVDLPEHEREGDREQADKILAVLQVDQK